MPFSKYGSASRRANSKIVSALKEIFYDKGITTCEASIGGKCSRWFALSFHHRHKRRWYLNKEHLLTSFNQAILVCAQCHDHLEQRPKETALIFEKLRGKEIDI